MGRAMICKVHVLDDHDPHLNYFTIFSARLSFTAWPKASSTSNVALNVGLKHS
jgi:hypothetical protein